MANGTGTWPLLRITSSLRAFRTIGSSRGKGEPRPGRGLGEFIGAGRPGSGHNGQARLRHTRSGANTGK